MVFEKINFSMKIILAIGLTMLLSGATQYPNNKEKRLIILVSPLENQTGIREEIIVERETRKITKRTRYTVDRYTEAPRALLENILSRYRNITLIERQRLDKILLETEYGRSSGYVDSKYLIEIGKQLGANTIAIGTLVSINKRTSKFQGYGIISYRNTITATIRFRLVNIKSSKVIFSISSKGKSETHSNEYGSLSTTDERYAAIEDAINNLSNNETFTNFMNR